MKEFLIVLLAFFVGTLVGIIFIGKKCFERMEMLRHISDKYQLLFQLMCRWLRNLQDEHNISIWLERNGYLHIAVYGMGEVGRCLVNELRGSNIVVEYAIDQQSNDKLNELKMYKPEDELPKVDCIVVTPVAYYDEIEEKLQTKVNCHIVSIEDAVYSDYKV